MFSQVSTTLPRGRPLRDPTARSIGRDRDERPPLDVYLSRHQRNVGEPMSASSSLPTVSSPLFSLPNDWTRRSFLSLSLFSLPLSAAAWADASNAETSSTSSSSTTSSSSSSSTSTVASASSDVVEAPSAVIELEQTPDQSLYPRDDPRLLEASNLVQRALNADTVEEEEQLWTRIIDDYGSLEETWAKDVVSRAWGNRGNARSRQGRLKEAIEDYNQAIRLSPWAVDPVLNRGVVLESLGDFKAAIRDYKAVLRVVPNDPSAWNNLGNAEAGVGDWEAASEHYGRAAKIAPQFAFASANKALADYQLGRDDDALRTIRNLLRKFPAFDDMRAALAAILWARGLQDEAENELLRVEDARYSDVSWIQNERRWPPRLVKDVSALLRISS